MKTTYFFGEGKADGNATEKNLLGGKGANLAEMTNLGIPVPPGFTISTEICKYYLNKNAYPNEFDVDIQNALNQIENIMKA